MVTSADAAPTGETPLQRYKRLRYQNAVIMGSPCGQSRRPGSPDESAGVPFERTVNPTSPLQSPTETSHNTPAKNSRHLRAYRLNLERPFNILNEQSPLEYGDYMKIWDEKDYPPTVGPVEYMPPRHLGGNVQVWRTLMQYGRIAKEGCSAEETDEHNANIDDDPQPLSYSNWRVLTEEETRAHQQLGEVDPQTGEYTFRSYDLSHVVERRFKNLSLQDLSIAEENVVHDADESPNSSPTSAEMELVTVLSTESNGSQNECEVVITEEEMAEMTARLFRRSEISLREKAEAEARQAAEEKKRKEDEERARRAEEKRMEMEERARAAKEGRKYKRSSTTGSSSSRRSGKFSSKKLMRSLSSISNKLVNELNGNTSDSLSGSAVCMNPKFKKSSSRQASAIEKARDLIDNQDEEVEGADCENKKPLNLYVYGEYDILNDLVNDGAKRLSRSKNLSDLELLFQNDPCPPPDRWVRPTGWSRCNPSSCYAANPPDGYDLDSYGKNLVKLPKEEDVTSSISPSSRSPVTSQARTKTGESPKDSNATQSTAAVSGSISEDLFEVTASPSLQKKSSSKSRNAPSSPVPQMKTAPTESYGTPQGVYQLTTNTAVNSSASGRTEKPSSSTSVKKKKSMGKRISGIFKA